MEPIIYCPHCGEEHVASETRDNEGIVVGLFCNRRKALISAAATTWGGEDVYPRLQSFLRRNVDMRALDRIESDKVVGLSRKMAYLFIQTTYAKDRRINYYWIQYHALKAIRRMKGAD